MIRYLHKQLAPPDPRTSLRKQPSQDQLVCKKVFCKYCESESDLQECSLESWKACVSENRSPVLERVVGMKSGVLHLQTMQKIKHSLSYKIWARTLKHLFKILRQTLFGLKIVSNLRVTCGMSELSQVPPAHIGGLELQVPFRHLSLESPTYKIFSCLMTFPHCHYHPFAM